MPRLCILSQYYVPEMGAPQARLSELAELLIDLDWEVEVLTALPNYPTGEVLPDYDPTRPCIEQIGRVRTVRVPLFTANSGFVKRLRSYFSFVASARRHGPNLCRPPDLLYVETPPLFIGNAARYLAKRWKCPYVVNVSDLWPESVIRMGVVNKGLATALAERFELKLYRHSAGVTGQSNEIIDSIKERSSSTPTAVVTNGVDPNRFGKHCVVTSAQALLGPEPGPVFIYAGLLGLAQGLDQILDLARSLPAEVPGRFVLVGEGPMRKHLNARIGIESINRVKIIPAQPRDSIPAMIAAADVAVVSLGMSLPGAVPSKIYEAMASSLPIMLIADGEAARRVAAAHCGLTVNPGDMPAARRVFCRLAGDPLLRRELGAAGRRAAENTYDRDAIALQLDSFLRGRIAASSAAGGRQSPVETDLPIAGPVVKGGIEGTHATV